MADPVVSSNPVQAIYRPRMLVTLTVPAQDWGLGGWGDNEWGNADAVKRYSTEDITV